jgi:hypothetical protein
MVSKSYYVAGPMTNIAQFNYPAFEAAAFKLRGMGYDVISPHEQDTDAVRDAAWNSPDGNLATGLPSGVTWGQILAKDVELVADKCEAVVFLPEWQKSRGAKLEATVGLLCGHKFYEYKNGDLWEVNPEYVKHQLASNL